MKRLVLVTLLTLVLSLTLTGIVYADNGDTTGDGDASAGGIALLLAPLVAAATAIERAIEMIFDFFEGIVLSFSGFLGIGKSYVGWARKRIEDARDLLTGETENTSNKTESELETMLRDAQQRFKKALKTEPYASTKRVISLLLGIVLGLIVAFLTRLPMFKLLHIDLVTLSGTDPASSLASFLTTMDIIITGLVIGTGSAPVHSLIGILQKSKDAIDEARALARGNSIEAIQDVLNVRLGSRAESTGRTIKQLSDIELERQIDLMLD